jgi:hypothetical protein
LKVTALIRLRVLILNGEGKGPPEGEGMSEFCAVGFSVALLSAVSDGGLSVGRLDEVDEPAERLDEVGCPVEGLVGEDVESVSVRGDGRLVGEEGDTKSLGEVDCDGLVGEGGGGWAMEDMDRTGFTGIMLF